MDTPETCDISEKINFFRVRRAFREVKPLPALGLEGGFVECYKVLFRGWTRVKRRRPLPGSLLSQQWDARPLNPALRQ
jgi:hypothetical protein